MRELLNFPMVFALVAFLIMWAAAQFGARTALVREFAGKELEEFNIVLGATLTLLGLIIGFTFSMAVGRYDQRKNYVEEEANAIGTEYVRVDLLPAADADKLHALLKQYLQQRILFYEAWHGDNKLAEIDGETLKLQNEMWSVVSAVGRTQQTQVIALAVSGMNDVLNRQGYTQAAWWNRIPVAAWGLMAFIAIVCNVLVGVAAHETKARRALFVLPFMIAIAFMLVADLDSPRGGIIRVQPQNLLALQSTMQ
jgi:hypothetical protein